MQHNPGARPASRQLNDQKSIYNIEETLAKQKWKFARSMVDIPVLSFHLYLHAMQVCSERCTIAGKACKQVPVTTTVGAHTRQPLLLPVLPGSQHQQLLQTTTCQAQLVPHKHADSPS